MSEPDWSKYEAVAGKRWGYYRPRFEKFARGGWLSWNRAAFFGTFAWLSYRRLHAWSWAYFFVSTPFLLSVLLFAVPGDTCEQALDPVPTRIITGTLLSLVALGWIVPPLLANRLYFDHVRAMAAKAEPVAGTGAFIGPLALQAVTLIVTIMVVPGIAHYVYRSMVSEGISLAGAAKTPVQEYLKERNRLPAKIEEVAGNTSGKYVGRLVLEADGTIRAIFGERGKKLSGRSVMLTPVKKDGNIVEWVCRSADLPATCLPASCR